jgi:Smr domain
VTDKVRVLMIKAGMPTVEAARASLNTELDKAKRAGAIVLKIVHGYGASGVGGRLRDAIRSSLRRRRKEGKIRAFVTGENWATTQEESRQFLEECPQLMRDEDLNSYNEGITWVLL